MNKYISIIVSSLIIISCSSDNPKELSEEPNISAENIYDEENRWIYSQMNRNYLWRTNLPDSLDCNYSNDPVTFFESLLSDKDRFSYCLRNSSYNIKSDQYNWGFSYQEYSTPDNDVYMQVLYVSSEDLKQQGLRRGDWLKEHSTNTSNTKQFKKYILSNNKFIETTSLIISTRDIYNSNSTVLLDSVYHIQNKRIGYMCYLEFNTQQELAPALNKFKEAHIEEMILDLRYNPGGYVSTCKYLCNCIVNEEAYNNIFQIHSYNDILTEELYKDTGDSLNIEYYSHPKNTETSLTAGIIPLKLKRIYILTSHNTASASEATIICLRPYMEVIVIGEDTYGKGVGSSTLYDSRYKYALQPIIFQYYNADMETVPGSGIKTDYYISDGYETPKREIGDIDEPLLSTAINIITGNNTPIKNINHREDNIMLTPVGEPSFVKEHYLKMKKYEH